VSLPDDEKAPTSAALSEPGIPPLYLGEERLLQTVHRADGHRNEIYLSHRRPDDDRVTGAGEEINFIAVIRSTDATPTDASPPRAWQRGPTERSVYIAVAEAAANVPPFPGSSLSFDADVQWFYDRIREDVGPQPSRAEVLAALADRYVAACGAVLDAAHACLDTANRSVGARSKIAEHQHDGLPGTPIAIRNFSQWAEDAERAFVPLYRTFGAVCADARSVAAALLGSDPLSAEMTLALRAQDTALDTVATAKGILGATYGPTPAEFLQGVAVANQLMQSADDEGNIFRQGAVPAQRARS
jgi:hypothetical protein